MTDLRNGVAQGVMSFVSSSYSSFLTFIGDSDVFVMVTVDGELNSGSAKSANERRSAVKRICGAALGFLALQHVAGRTCCAQPAFCFQTV